jgi:hypothetical protein
VARKRLTAADVRQIIGTEIAELQSAVEYDEHGHCGRADRLRREAAVLAVVLDPGGRAAS